MEEVLERLEVSTTNKDYLIEKVDDGISLNYLRIANNDIKQLLFHLSNLPLRLGESHWFRGYHISRSRNAITIGGLASIYYKDIDEVVSAIKILTGDVKWKKS